MYPPLHGINSVYVCYNGFLSSLAFVTLKSIPVLMTNNMVATALDFVQVPPCPQAKGTKDLGKDDSTSISRTGLTQ